MPCQRRVEGRGNSAVECHRSAHAATASGQRGVENKVDDIKRNDSYSSKIKRKIVKIYCASVS